jgi:Tesmin/TSO1-like CXC domain, cysteine-rich domain
MQPLQQEGQANEVITTTRDSTPTTDIRTIVPITGTAVGETAAAAMAQEQQPQLHQGQTLPASASGVHPTEAGTAATGTRATSAEVHSTAVARAEAATVAAAAGMRTENVVGVNQAPGQEAASSRETSTPQVAGAKVNPSHQAVGLRPDATRQLVATRPQQPVRTSPPQQMAGYQHQPHHGLPNTFQPSDLGGVAQPVPQYAPAHMLAVGQPRYAALPSTAGAPPNAPGQRQFQTSPDQAVGVPGGHRDTSPSAASVPYAIEARAAAAAAAYRSQNPIESAKYQMLLPNDITTAAAAAAAARRQSESAEMSHWPIVEEDPLPIYFRATDGIGTACADGLRRKRKEEWQAAVAIPIPPRMVGSLREHEVQSNKACACKNSACLKLYCECFASGFLCTSACACDNQPGTEKQCRNNHENLSVRHLSIIQAIQRNPHHFSQNMNPISLGSPQSSPTARSQAVPASRKPVHVPDEKKRTCNCSKSKCLKVRNVNSLQKA